VATGAGVGAVAGSGNHLLVHEERDHLTRRIGLGEFLVAVALETIAVWDGIGRPGSSREQEPDQSATALPLAKGAPHCGLHGSYTWFAVKQPGP